ncbi:UPF0175 family protein [Candidatus Thiothrix sp. Deng01]|uniref:UPF0175 family protein n=1 Tax=Candidatus Thiothrix phosphatis TaxID=3112415 RepID=A0ABU6CXI0_9GAMM|nr:UPF0175 family protein [Candidatus Thiothrix sp. Deng01]MEB4591540.1 UPF0175 family protein [Candidatus Thiothrix sp. Deng01]
MNVIGIKELQTNPGKLSHSLLNNEYMLITRRGEPLGVALPFGTQLLENGMKNWVALKAFQAGDLSLGQLGKVLGKNKHETLTLLGELNIPFADYDLQEDLQTLDELFPA